MQVPWNNDKLKTEASVDTWLQQFLLLNPATLKAAAPSQTRPAAGAAVATGCDAAKRASQGGRTKSVPARFTHKASTGTATAKVVNIFAGHDAGKGAGAPVTNNNCKSTGSQKATLLWGTQTARSPVRQKRRVLSKSIDGAEVDRASPPQGYLSKPVNLLAAGAAPDSQLRNSQLRNSQMRKAQSAVTAGKHAPTNTEKKKASMTGAACKDAPKTAGAAAVAAAGDEDGDREEQKKNGGVGVKGGDTTNRVSEGGAEQKPADEEPAGAETKGKKKDNQAGKSGKHKNSALHKRMRETSVAQRSEPATAAGAAGAGASGVAPKSFRRRSSTDGGCSSSGGAGTSKKVPEDSADVEKSRHTHRFVKCKYAPCFVLHASSALDLYSCCGCEFCLNAPLLLHCCGEPYCVLGCAEMSPLSRQWRSATIGVAK